MSKTKIVIKGELKSGDYKEVFEILCKDFGESVEEQEKKTMIKNKIVWTIDGIIKFCKDREGCKLSLDTDTNSFTVTYPKQETKKPITVIAENPPKTPDNARSAVEIEDDPFA